MRDVIKKVLAEWLLKFSRNDEEWDSLGSSGFSDVSEENWDRVLWLDRHLMGVALFLAEVAEESNDTELLGIATRAKKIAEEKIAKEFQEDQQQQQQRQEGYETHYDTLWLPVSDACRPVFASIGRAGVDMSKYRKAIEDSRPYFNNPSDYVSLLLYADERKVFKKVCAEVFRAARDCANKNNRAVLEPEWIRQKFGSVLSETYRKADKYVAQQLKRYAPQNLIPPIGANET